MGSTSNNPHRHRSSVSINHAMTLTELGKQVQRFWEQHEVDSQKIPTPDDTYCEEHFSVTHSRNSSGRYTIRLPMRHHFELGEARTSAVQQLLSLERRLSKNEDLRSKYIAFLDDYLIQGHMREVGTPELHTITFYLPHHAVIKLSDQGGKLRVVFNASAKSSNGYSLNDHMLPGPKLHEDLWLVLSRWRLFKYAFTVDVVQMFRQIDVHHADQNLQRILWRTDPTSPIKEFCLTTVTYGTAAAPFLAIRTLLQLASDEATNYPHGAVAIRKHTYVDDILYGGYSLSQALERRQQLVDLLLSGGFSLSKWAANNSELCPDPLRTERLFADSKGISTLGLLWSAKEDTFHLRVVPACTTENCTKRTVLSDIARFFDPLGWATPVLIYGRIFLQELWKAKLGWDELLPEELRLQWIEFVSILPDLHGIAVPRHVQYSPGNCAVSLHGFSDASEKAFAAVLYLRCTVGTTVFVNLLVAKSRVAPLTVTSIPRLELCDAVLLAKLMQTSANGLGFSAAPWHLWTDAQVVLHWLRAHPSKWLPYMAHRVSAIQEIVEFDRWHHVATDHNPADLCTRGITTAELAGSSLWWHGPEWLALPESEWPKTVGAPDETINASAEKAARCTVAVATTHYQNELLSRYSSLTRLKRIVALCLRFKHNTKTKPKLLGFLTTQELRSAEILCIHIAQRDDFSAEITTLQTGGRLPSRSSLLPLQPVISDDGLLRVGGRLAFSRHPIERRHPVILSKNNPLSLLFMRHAHAISLHGGPQLMRSVLSYIWIIRGLSLAKSVARTCVRCIRYRSDPARQQMGVLPPERVIATRPFLTTGVDFAGPFTITAHRGRGFTSVKTYLALFVCFSSKAVHLEVVSDLSTAAFIAAFKRFTARRGHCHKLFSDNATNFRGAEKELRSMFKESADSYQTAAALLASLGTEWSFIPPSTPHFGGLWESGVKSVKHHLRRIVGDQILSLEEMQTLMCQSEACLNSRPLCPVSNAPSDFSAITPGHLLIGEPMVNVPEQSYHDQSDRHPLSRWQHVSRMRDHFWQRWSSEYLQQLQTRQRWTHPHHNLTVGMLVIIKDQLLPPAKWLLGRVTQVHPGPDELVRVVTLRTMNGIVKRPIHKLCPLPIPVETKD